MVNPCLLTVLFEGMENLVVGKTFTLTARLSWHDPSRLYEIGQAELDLNQQPRSHNPMLYPLSYPLMVLVAIYWLRF